MQAYWTLTRRELASYFLSLSGYIIIAAVTLLIALSFVFIVMVQGGQPFPMPVTEMFFNTPLFWFILILAVPIITMRLFALEKSSGTFETLMTTPVSDLQVVAAKFTGAVIFYMLMWLPTLGSLFVLRHFTNQSASLDLGAVAGMYLGIFLNGCLLLSVGGFASALTRSQAIAAMISLAVGFSLLILAYLAMNPPALDRWLAMVLSYFNLFDQMRDFVRGVVDTRPIVFSLSATLFFLFLTLRVVESRRWK